MSENESLIKLYSQRILSLATTIPKTEQLENPQASCKTRSPLCGSTVTVDIIVENGTVTGYGQNVKACALGQAAASVVGANIVGCSRDEIETGLRQLASMLKEGGPPPGTPFAELHVLEPAKEFKNRHASIMLALEAALCAYDRAANPA
ncbi:MAG: iron-sulfur cluster assembly scaffold protein [Rhodobacteraceae bacterium]|nr:iron-sulfur cluster assembly scaffold protein [Paracoccaceae bacterium]